MPTLVFSVPSLYFLVHALLYLALQDARSLRFVKASDLENLCSVEPGVGSPTHDCYVLAYPCNKIS